MCPLPPEPGDYRATAQGGEWEEGDSHIRMEVYHQHRRSQVLGERPETGPRSSGTAPCLPPLLRVVPGGTVRGEARKVVGTRP